MLTVSIIFGKRFTEIICKIAVIDSLISLSYCCYTTLGNINRCALWTMLLTNGGRDSMLV